MSDAVITFREVVSEPCYPLEPLESHRDRSGLWSFCRRLHTGLSSFWKPSARLFHLVLGQVLEGAYSQVVWLA